MNIGLYNIVNDSFPKLNLIKEIKVYKREMKADTSIVNMLNRELLFNKLYSEHNYALVLRTNLDPLGILDLGGGTCFEAAADLRTLGTGVLLLGGEQFMCFHNHPGGVEIVSDSDKLLTSCYEAVARILGLRFIRHLMVTDDSFYTC